MTAVDRAEPGGPTTPGATAPSPRVRSSLVAGGFLAAVVVPFVVTALRLRHPRPYVVLDLAQTEMRVRAVFSAHPPLIGLPGRLGVFGEHIGSHPGPASFWVLAPFWKLYGSTPWAMFAAALSVNFLWIAVALWIAHRRGGLRTLVWVGAVVLLLVHTFGMVVVEQPWNPYLPLMAWTVVLLAAWSVLDDDLAMLPVLVVAASWCMQIHIPYLGMGAGVLAATVAGTVVWRHLRRRLDGDRAADEPGRIAWLTGDPADRPSTRRMWGWIGGSAVLGLALWSLPILDQLHTAEGGNLSLLADDLLHPPEAAGGLSQGVHLVLAHLDVWQLLTGHRIEFVVINSNVPGFALLAVWIVGCVFAWRFRMRRLVLLDALIAWVLVLGTVALSKIYGELFWYLMMWMWTVCAAMVASIVAVGIEAVRRSGVADRTRAIVRTGGTGVLVAGLVTLFVATTIEATHATIPDRNLSSQMAELVPPTVAALRAHEAPCTTDGRVLVTWEDLLKIGDGGYTMLDQLEGAGFDVGLRRQFLGIVPARQIIPEGAEACVVHLAVGEPAIERFAARNPDAVIVARSERTPAQRTEYARLEERVRRIIADAGGDPDVIEKGVTASSLDTDLPLAATQLLSRMSEIGLPMAVFLAPAGATPF